MPKAPPTWSFNSFVAPYHVCYLAVAQHWLLKKGCAPFISSSITPLNHVPPETCNRIMKSEPGDFEGNGGSCSTSSQPESAGIAAHAEEATLQVNFSFSESRRRTSKAGCIVAGCSVALSTRYELVSLKMRLYHPISKYLGSPYPLLQRYRLCTAHMKAPQFLIAGELHRWCQVSTA